MKEYNKWQELYNEHADRSMMVQYDQLICNRDVLLSTMQAKFNLVKKHETFINEDQVVNASTDHGLIINNTQFDTRYYTERQYMDEIPDNITRVITRTLHNTRG